MKRVSKRESVHNPTRRKGERLTAEQIHAELGWLCKNAAAEEAQAALRNLRR
jgi:hypothetical protein